MKCVICSRRDTDRAQVCDPDRSWLDRTLIEIVELYALLPAQLIPGRVQGQRVSGSREAPLPLRVDPLDLTLPARAATVHEPPCTCTAEQQRPDCRPGYPHLDQGGHVPVASRLDSWVADWRNTIRCGDLTPGPTVVEIVRWLRIWLDEACDTHPAIDEFHTELRELLSDCRRAAGRIGVRPEVKVGVPCRECERVALFRRPASDYIECGHCGLLLTPEEYERWTQLISAKEWEPWVREILKADAAS